MRISRSKWWNVLLFGLVASWFGLEASQWLFRIRAERLLADIKSLQVNHSSWSDAQGLMDRWGRWGGWYGSCTPEDCQYDIAVRHLSLVSPQFAFEGGPHPGARILELLGLRSAGVTATFHVVHGVVTDKGFRMSVALPVSDWITPNGGFWLKDKIGSTYWPSIEVASFEGVKLRGASAFTIGKYPNRGFVQRRILLEASFTPEEVPAEQAALMDFHFECITRWKACTSRAQILPQADAEFEAISQEAHLDVAKGKSATPEPCSLAPRELGRDAIDILRVEALATQPTDGTYSDEGYGQGEFDTVKLLEVLKSPIHWKSGHVFRVHPFPGRRTEQDDFSPEHLAVGNTYYLLYSYFLDNEPHGEHDLIGLTRCGVFEDTPAIRGQLLDGAGISQHSN
jgi:hypothetical protein